jgi:hypothetical protein
MDVLARNSFKMKGDENSGKPEGAIKVKRDAYGVRTAVAMAMTLFIAMWVAACFIGVFIGNLAHPSESEVLFWKISVITYFPIYVMKNPSLYTVALVSFIFWESISLLAIWLWPAKKKDRGRAPLL